MSNFGLLLINKPAGPTSHDIIYKLRRITGIKKIGHAGTLDPFAQGLLLVMVGREATRQISNYVGLGKEYEVKLKLGAISDTHDCQGKIKVINSTKKIKIIDIKKILKKFIGQQSQLPPMYSAKKINGRKLCDLARQGIKIKRKPQQIEIYKIKKIKLKNNDLFFVVSCSSGTYIRVLAHDLGRKLGCGAYVERLIRTKIGKFNLQQAVEIKQLNSKNWPDFLQAT